MTNPRGWFARATLAYGGWLLDRSLLAWSPFFLAGYLWCIGLGAHAGWWGGPLRQAWNNEVVAARNVSVGEQVLREWDAQKAPSTSPPPSRPKKKKKGEPPPPALTRDDWLKERDAILEKIEIHGEGVTHVWRMFGATQPAAWEEAYRLFWRPIYRAHHLVLRTIYIYPIGLWMLVGAGWAFFDRRRIEADRKERIERERREAEQRAEYERHRQEQERKYREEMARKSKEREEELAALERARPRIGVIRSERAELGSKTEIQLVPARKMNSTLAKVASDDLDQRRDRSIRSKRSRTERPANQVRRPKAK